MKIQVLRSMCRKSCPPVSPGSLQNPKSCSFGMQRGIFFRPLHCGCVKQTDPKNYGDLLRWQKRPYSPGSHRQAPYRRWQWPLLAQLHSLLQFFPKSPFGQPLECMKTTGRQLLSVKT